jgi:Ribbon-helix-helix protein, copG family
VFELANMNTAISLPDPLFRAADRLAKRLGISRSELVQRALTLLIDEHESAIVTAALDGVYGRPDVPQGVDPVLMKLQLAAIKKDDW